MNQEAQAFEGMRQPTEKLTDWKNEPSLRTLKQDVEAAKPIQKEHMLHIQRWLDNLNVTGQAKIKAAKGRSTVQPKLIRKQAEWRYSALTEPFLAADKVFTISPVSWEDKRAAEQNELLLNWQFRTKLNPVVFIDQYARTCVNEGTVAVRVGWLRETRDEQVQAPVYAYYPITSPEQIQALTEAMQLEMENPGQFAELPDEIKESVRYSQELGEPVLAEIVGYEEVIETKVLKNQPTVEVININNLLIDATCGADPNQAMFMCYSSEVTRSSLKIDGRYKNLDAIDWKGKTILSEPDHISTGPAEVNFEDESRQKVVMIDWYGVYDIHGDGHLVPIHVAWIGDVMVLAELNPFPDGKPPFVIVPYLPKQNSLYGEPDGELLEDNQKIIGAVTRGVLDMMARSANAQRGIAKSMLDIPNKRKFDNGEDYEFNPSIHPSQGIVEHKFPEIPQSAAWLIQAQNADGESMTGVKTYHDQGLTGASLGRVAAAAQAVTSAMGQREMGILRRLAMGVSLIGQKIVAMNQEFLSEEEVVRVTNEQFVTVRRDELHGNFDMKVDITSADDDNAKAQELSFMYQTVGPNGDVELNKMILSEIFRLRRMPDLAKQVKEYQPQPDPLDQALKELEIAEKQAKVELIKAQAMERQAQAALDMAKARTEGSTADQKDLDYVEQESGVKHARDIDKAGQQAEANKNLAITQGLMKAAQKKNADGTTGIDPGAVQAAVGFNNLTRQGL